MKKTRNLRRAAVRNLGLVRSDESSKALAEIYARETDRGIREEVLNAYFLQGNAGAHCGHCEGRERSGT